MCTASNKAFLCISSRIVTFFLIEQSCVAKTSCKMSAKHLRFSRDVINLPLWTKQLNLLLSSCRSEYIFSIGSTKDGQSFWCRQRKQKQRSDTDHPPSPNIHTHFLACLVTMLRGGVTGRLPLGFFFSAGFKICKTQLGMLNLLINMSWRHSWWDSFLKHLVNYYLLKKYYIKSIYEAAYLKRAHEGLVHAHHGAGVVKLPTIVRC